jgi:hypothetical protein
MRRLQSRLFLGCQEHTPKNWIKSLHLKNNSSPLKAWPSVDSILGALRNWIARDGSALVLFCMAASAAMYPVMSSPSIRVIGWLGDNVQYIYMTGWVAEALRTFQSFLVDPHLNYPDVLLLPTTDAPFLSMIVAAPITWMSNPILAYNLIIFLSHVLSGYFAYLWIRRLTSSRFGGLVAGLLFLLSPYRIAHSYGHLQLVSTQFMPLFFWALDNALQGEKPRVREMAILGLATFLVGSAMSQYYLFICMMAGVVYTLCSINHTRYLVHYGWKLIATVAVGAVISAWPYLVSKRFGFPCPISNASLMGPDR